MTRFSLKGAALLTTTLFAGLASAVEYISINGSNFVIDATQQRFDLIGITYQPGGSSGFNADADPLSDADTCLRDAIIMQKLGVNTVRIYNLDPDLDHNECMSIFNAAGIYMLLDVNSGLYGQYIDRTDPSSTYTLDYMEHIFSIVEAFWGFPNVLGFFAGNEIINESSDESVPMYIRAVVRDLKEYISLHGPRSIGVGYSAADVADMLTDTWAYLGCELDNSTYSKMDFFGLNDYEWCGDSSYTESGYDKLVTDFAGTDIPVFFSEYGCNNIKPRTFTNVPVLYGDEMEGLSGGLAYEYSEETDAYGVVSINSTTEITLLEDFQFLTEEFAKIDVSARSKLNTTAESVAATSCAASLIAESTFLSDWNLPERPSGGDDLVTSGLASSATVSIGSLVSVTATTMPATVYNYTGAEVTGLALVSLGCADVNYPGLIATYTATDETCSYATSTGGSNSTDSSAAYRAVGDSQLFGMIAVVFSGLIGGVLLL